MEAVLAAVGAFAATDLPASAGTDPGLNDACGDDPNWLCERVFDATDGNETLARLADWVVGRPLTVVMILLVAWLVTRLSKRYLTRAVGKIVAPDRDGARRSLERLGIDRPELILGDREDDPRADARRDARAHSIALVLGSTVTIIVWTIAIIMVLGEFNVNLGPLIAGAGIAGVALGFGAQSLVKDCITGLFMLMEDQYGIGDVIDTGEAIGEVQEFSLRVTVLRSLDGTVWHVPNGEIRRVGNMSQLWSTALVDIDVAYDADLERARSVILDTAGEVCADDAWAEHVLDEPDVLGVETLGADGVTLRMVVRTAPGTQWGLQRALREALKVAMDEAGIEIPFPQRSIWVRSGEA